MENSIFKTRVDVPFKVGDYITINGKRERINGMLIYITQNTEVLKVRFQVGSHHQITIPCYIKGQILIRGMDSKEVGLQYEVEK